MASKKKKPAPLDFETVDIPIPKGDSDRHLYEMKLLLTVPAGYSPDEVHGAILSWILRGARGRAEVGVEYGAAIKNKTLMNPKDRSAFIKRVNARMICTGYDNKALPRDATTLKVLRVKQKEKKNVARRTNDQG